MSDERLTVRSYLREYEVAFVDDIVPLIREIGNSTIVVDRVVAGLHGDRLRPIVDEAIILDATEENKTLDGCRRLIETLVERRFRRDHVVVAIGGGIIQDIAAFSASILYRGVEWVFVPTTLLAQADSCIGSKTSINLGDKKNLIGNFYPPSRIFVDSAFLDTLSVEDIKSGIGEMLHFYYYADSPMVGQLMADYDRLLSDRGQLRAYIRESLRIKRSVAERDEFDRGERNKFNYGHTFGHALESATQYGIRHGLAVTVGMDLANYVSLKLGKMSSECFKEIHTVLLRNFPDHDLSTVNMERYFAALMKDKKNVGNDLVCILASGPGRLERVRLEFKSDVMDWIRDYFRSGIWQTHAMAANALKNA